MNIDVESKITLDKFQLRWYQEELWDAVENHNIRRVLYIAPRRSGKDISSFNLLIRQCLRKVCLVLHCLPTYRLARRIIWDGLTIDGIRFLDYIPKQLIANINQTEMKITFHNGSILQLIGADNFDASLIGTNPYAVVLSEFAVMQNGNEVYQLIRPILAANGGWMCIVSTPRGHNALWHLYKLAQEMPGWHVIYQKTSEIQHIDADVLAQEKAEISDELYMQEFECFPGDSLVLTTYGYRKISQIQEGDIVLTHNMNKCRVLHVFRKKYNGELIVINGMSCTPEHPIRVFNYETYSDIWVPARDIQMNDYLSYPESKSAELVVSIDSRKHCDWVYNLHVDVDESYIVSGIAVHNCSFSRGIEGTYYGKYIDRLRANGQICDVPYEAGLQVHVSLDIGVNDPTALIFWQSLSNGAVIRIIDCYSNTGHGIDHYANIIRQKRDDHGYVYGKFFAPFDLKTREWGGGAITRYEKARQLGLDFIILDQIGVQDGIENVWTHFNKFWIDQTKCRSLISALENYRREWDEVHRVHKNKPVHNWASNYADALRYMCMSLHKTQRGLTPEEFERKKHEAIYGDQGGLPRFFRDEPKYDRYG